MFNLRAKRRKHPLGKLRALSDDCLDLRPSDIAGLSDEEAKYLADRFRKEASVRTAYHGDAGTFFPVDPNSNPYKSSPLVNANPPFGGRWRGDFPGSGDQHINDDSDKQKSTRGDSANDDFDPAMKKVRMNDLMDGILGPKYVVRLILGDHEDATDGRAQELLGSGAKAKGRSMYVELPNYERALRLQRAVPGSVVEPLKN